jgi:hypothetical protein
VPVRNLPIAALLLAATTGADADAIPLGAGEPPVSPDLNPETLAEVRRIAAENQRRLDAADAKRERRQARNLRNARTAS